MTTPGTTSRGTHARPIRLPTIGLPRADRGERESL